MLAEAGRPDFQPLEYDTVFTPVSFEELSISGVRFNI